MTDRIPSFSTSTGTVPISRVGTFSTSTGSAPTSRIGLFSTSTGTAPSSRILIFSTSTGPMATDRIEGLSIGVAVKPACVVKSTGAITLSGVQTVDGISVGSNSERVLVGDQASSVNNGIYIADSSSWIRASDCDGSKDLIPGSVVYVDRGTSYGRTFWVFNSSSTDYDVSVGTDNITTSQVSVALAGVSSFIQNNFLPAVSASSARSVLNAAGTTDANTFTASNTFTPSQTFSTNVTIDGGLTVRSTLQSASFSLFRQATSTGEISSVGFYGSTGSTAKTLAAEVRGEQTQEGAQGGRIVFGTRISGTYADKFGIGQGFYASSASDLGAGTINVDGGVYKSGLEYGLSWTYSAQTTLTTTSVTLSTAVTSSVTEIEVLVDSCISSSAAPPAVLLGTSTGTVSSGYLGSAGTLSGAGGGESIIADALTLFRPSGGGYSTSTTLSGTLKLTRWASTEYRWFAQAYTTLRVSTADTIVGVMSADITLSGELVSVILTSTGASAFASGEARIRYR